MAWVLVLLTAGAGASAPALAQQAAAPDPGWSIGGAVISAPRPYVGADAEVIPIPLVQYESPRLYVQGIVVGYRLIPGERFALDVHAQPRFDGFENDDSPFLTGMEEPDPSLDLGLGLEGDLGSVELGLALDADVLGRSDGYRAEATVGRTYVYRRGQVIFGPEIGLSWQSEDVVDYYYGVSQAEARPGRPAYRGDAGTSLDVGAFLQVRLNPRWSVVSFVEWSSLPDEIGDSPIVEDDSTLFGLIGLLYRM
jgi:outer membrane protein